MRVHLVATPVAGTAPKQFLVCYESGDATDRDGVCPDSGAKCPEVFRTVTARVMSARRGQGRTGRTALPAIWFSERDESRATDEDEVCAHIVPVNVVQASRNEPTHILTVGSCMTIGRGKDDVPRPTSPAW
jgi:hypothetical protein